MIDMLFAGESKKIESVKIETPLGTIESDSGNHIVDILSIIGIIGVLFLGKVLVNKYFGK